VIGKKIDQSPARENNGRDNQAFAVERHARYFAMRDFERKVEETSARVNKTVAEAAASLEKETADFITYLNNEVVPAVRQHSTKALRIAADKMTRLAEYMEKNSGSR
jgi:glutamyl-tRNA reductase